ncbi:MAG: type II secretion system protein GspE [Acidobacteria bacterium]|nr:MAG: type II secretion system protein GspE [Acidobacteriota bacterium]PYS14165.1 MAG: type II secretion system protein GspE [Acidobacteriota bacterium]
MKIPLASETKPLGQLLRERGLISEEDLKNALVLQQERTDKIGRILIDLGYVAERDILAVVSDQLKIPIFDGEYPAVPIEADRLPFRFLRAFNVIPVHLENGVLRIVMADPLDLETQNSIRLRTGFALQVFLGVEAEIQAQLERLHGGDDENSTEKLIETLGDFGADDENIEHLRDLASEAPVIRLVNLMISRAIESRASDIHLEPFEKELRLRYRVDGVLQNMDSPPNALRAAIISRIKLMAKLNIAERRLPQDGRIKLKVLGREIDLRVSTLPTMYGESVVMRILDRSNSSLIDLRRLGFPDDLYEKICQMTSKPHGIFLVTGPTGSGKSTTLYSALKRINIPDRKIITIEDPIEYQMDGINQIHVNPQIGLTFAAGLRHIVRQDPDVIMIGEIRDLETADIAIRSSLTGHLVFSTVHTNDAPSAVTRLVDMGVEDYLLASSLIGILAQRLVRVNCKGCKGPEKIPASLLAEAGFDVTGLGEFVELQKGSGCKACDDTGYESRIGIFELLDIDDAMRHLIVKTADATVLKAEAVRSGMRTLKQDGWSKVLAGLTSPDEVLRVTQEV